MATGNADETRAKILEAATAEFARRGIAGARVERIARDADCNKNLLYVYFGNKDSLFRTVLERNLSRVYDELPFTPDDLPGYALRVHDFAMEHPALMRLLLWSTLELDEDPSAVRIRSQEDKVAAVERAQQAGGISGRFPAAFLLTVVMALSTAWSAAGPFGPSLNPDLAGSRDQLRRTVADAVAALSAPDLR
jgi:AcrR family transcriptional regulator